MRPLRHILAISIATLTLAGTVRAQSGELPTSAPVDQAVGDLDVLSTSLRRVEVGLNMNGQGTSLYRLDPWDDPAAFFEQPVYYRLGPGFRARVNRLDYLVIANPFPIPNVRENDLGINVAGIDGLFVEGTTANTVYDLRPINILGPDGVDLTALRERELRDIQPREDARIARRVNRSVTTQRDAGPVNQPTAFEGDFHDPVTQPREQIDAIWPRDLRRDAEHPRVLEERARQREARRRIRETPAEAQNAPKQDDAENKVIEEKPSPAPQADNENTSPDASPQNEDNANESINQK